MNYSVCLSPAWARGASSHVQTMDYITSRFFPGLVRTVTVVNVHLLYIHENVIQQQKDNSEKLNKPKK